jgi:hypothetical protein
MPLQAENDVKMNHLHYHVSPRTSEEECLFPVPSPNSFNGFLMPSNDAVITLARSLK